MADQDNTIRLAPGVHLHESEVAFTFVQSRGPGGQNVNKRATKAEMRVALTSLTLNDGARRRFERLAGRLITDAGEVLITSDRTRSQRRNRQDCIDRLSELVVRALTPPKIRKATKPSYGSVQRRLEAKRQRGEIKRSRRDPE